MVDKVVIRNGEASIQDAQNTSAFNTDHTTLPGHDRNFKEVFNHQGTAKVTDGVMQQDNVSRTTIQNDGRMVSSESLNFQTPDGRAISDYTQVTGESMVQIGGTWTTVSAALRQGLLTRKGAGGHFEPSAELVSLNQIEYDRQQESDKVYEIEFMPEHRETLNQLKARMGSAAFDGALALVVQEIMKGADGDATRMLADISNQAQVEPTSLLNFLTEAINDGFSAGIEFASEQYGIDPEAAVEWAMKEWTVRARSQFVVACLRNNVTDIKAMARAIRNRDRV